MKFVLKRISLVLGALSFSHLGHGWGQGNQRGAEDKILSPAEISNYSSECAKLIILENSPKLNLKQEQLGRLIYEVISQISAEPLAYCDELAMGAVIEEGVD